MSASDPIIKVEARSSLSDPADALRDALGQIAKQLASAGAGPHHLFSMTWTAQNPGDFHPARRAIGYAYREIFVGFRPPITFVQSSDENLHIAATAKRPGPPDNTPVWQNYSLAELAGQYSARSQVPDMQPVFRQWTKDGNDFRSLFKSLDIAYGPSADECFDLYHPHNVFRPPLWVFIHGGYWQAVSKEQNAQFAAGLVRAGFAVANLDYGLCPDTPLTEIVNQIKRALRFIHDNADALAIDATHLNLVGHSAGAHLAALTVADIDAPEISSALLISGLFELAPLALLPMGKILGLTDTETISRLSASTKSLRPATKIGLALGSLESAEFKRQSLEQATTWSAQSPLIVEGRNHFTILDELIDGQLLDFAIDLAGMQAK